ncbi:MAG: hypothetical protein V4683_01485 [Bacteroidota bacterium]
MKAKLLFSLLFLGLFVPITFSQKITRANHSITIYNPTATGINIQMGPSLNSLYPYLIPANDVWTSPLLKTNQVIVLTSSFKRRKYTKNYNLQLGMRYILYWNKNLLEIRSQ